VVKEKEVLRAMPVSGVTVMAPPAGGSFMTIEMDAKEEFTALT